MSNPPSLQCSLSGSSIANKKSKNMERQIQKGFQISKIEGVAEACFGRWTFHALSEVPRWCLFFGDFGSEMAQWGLFFGGFVFALWQQGNVKRTGPGQPSNFFLLQKIGQQTKGSIQAPGKGNRINYVRDCKKQADTTILSPNLLFLISLLPCDRWWQTRRNDEPLEARRECADRP